MADYLSNRGWTTTETTMADLFAAHGQPEERTVDFGSFTYVIAERVDSH
jgi:hypothetical protein